MSETTRGERGKLLRFEALQLQHQIAPALAFIGGPGCGDSLDSDRKLIRKAMSEIMAGSGPDCSSVPKVYFERVYAVLNQVHQGQRLTSTGRGDLAAIVLGIHDALRKECEEGAR